MPTPGGLEHEYDDESWARFKSEAVSRWPELTEAELEASRNDEELLLALLKQRYALTRPAALEQVAAVQVRALE